jgi:hypothetical protein
VGRASETYPDTTFHTHRPCTSRHRGTARRTFFLSICIYFPASTSSYNQRSSERAGWWPGDGGTIRRPQHGRPVHGPWGEPAEGTGFLETLFRMCFLKRAGVTVSWSDSAFWRSLIQKIADGSKRARFLDATMCGVYGWEYITTTPLISFSTSYFVLSILSPTTHTCGRLRTGKTARRRGQRRKRFTGLGRVEPVIYLTSEGHEEDRIP